MSISYPLSMPALPGIAQVTLRMQNIVAQSVSPFTAQEQVYQHPGTWWELDFSLPLMKRATAENWLAFLGSLKGRWGTFLAGDPAATGLLGNAGGTVTVDGASQTGPSLIIAGLTGTLQPGDYIQIGSGTATRLYKNLTQQTGNPCTLDIFPNLRESPANGASVTLGSCLGTFRLVNNSVQWAVDEGGFYTLTFSAREAY